MRDGNDSQEGRRKEAQGSFERVSEGETITQGQKAIQAKQISQTRGLKFRILNTWPISWLIGLGHKLYCDQVAVIMQELFPCEAEATHQQHQD